MSLQHINELQEQLQKMLGNKYSSYLENMRDWFGQRVTKDFFDDQMAYLLQDGALKIHNEMMRQILSHCHNPSGSSATRSFPSSTATRNVNRDDQQLKNSYSQNCEQVVTYHVGESAEDGESGYVTINYVANDAEDSNSELIVLEELKPEEPVDWLYNVDIVHVDKEAVNEIPYICPKNRFPMGFSNKAQQIRSTVEGNQTSDTIVNVTHTYDIADRLEKSSKSRPHFKAPVHENQAYLSAGASIHGKFLLKAWEAGLDTVEKQATSLAVEGVKEHILRLVTEIVKQRKAFRMRNDKVFHSVGSPYPNPYLLQGQQLFDNPYSSDSTRMADVMQVPTLLPTADEQERLACFQVSSAAPSKNCRFPSNRATLADLRNVIEKDPRIVPNVNLRFKLMGIIHQNYKGWGGAFSDDEDEEGELLPICLY